MDERNKPPRYLLLAVDQDADPGRTPPTVTVMPFDTEEEANVLGERLYEHHRQRRMEGIGGSPYVGLMDLRNPEHYDDPADEWEMLREWDEEFGKGNGNEEEE